MKTSILTSLLLALTLSSAFADGQNIDIHDCRVSIEKAGVFNGTHEENQVVLYLKTTNGFDSPIVAIAFQGITHWVSDSRTNSYAVAEPASLFPGAQDFWKIAISTSANNDIAVYDTYQSGVFDILTVNGTHYWLRAPGGVNFMFDESLYDNLGATLARAGLPIDGYRNGFNSSPDHAVFTKDAFPYLNPNGCN